MESATFAHLPRLESFACYKSYNVEREKMAYCSEFASPEDIQKYGLAELWDRYHQGEVSLRGLPSFRFNWTVDKEKNIYLLRLGEGREEFSNRIRFLFWVRGTELYLELDKFGAVDFHKSVGLVEWKLVKVNQLEGWSENLVQELKAALEAHGHRGASNPVDDCTVICHF